MKLQRRGFLGGLLTVPFLGVGESPAVTAPFLDVAAAKRAWRAYVAKAEAEVARRLWAGESFQQMEKSMATWKAANPPPPHAKVKDRLRAYEEIITPLEKAGPR